MKLNKLLLALAASGIATSAFATNGYFATGVGVKAKAMGGASIAFAEDGFGAAANPANLAQVKDGYSVGVSAFAPDRAVNGAGLLNPGAGQNAGISTASHTGNEAADAFAIPEFSYSKALNDKLNAGVVVYGNGGMNVDYGKQMYDPVGGKTTTVNLEQLFIAPTVSYKLNDQHTVAASLNLVYQRFEATGLSMFADYTSAATFNSNTGASLGTGVDPGNHGVDDSTGVGVRLGWLGKLSNTVTAGAFYQPKTDMSKFSAYKNLFAEAGDFDIPDTYGVGLGIQVSPKTAVALDVVQINYTSVKSISNKNPGVPGTPGVSTLGDTNGNGFGWSDMTVYKLGVSHQLDEATTIRAGWNYGKQPIAKDQLDFNLLAPAVTEHHFTFGATRALDKDASVSMHVMYAPNVKITGTPTAQTGTYSVSALEMSQIEIGLQYSKKF
jgi:long-chain fatty acid transport protein